MPIINQIVKGSGGSAPAHYIEKSVDANGVLGAANGKLNMSGVTKIDAHALQYAYYESSITGAAFENATSLTEINGQEALQHAFNGSSVTSTGLNYVQTIVGIRVMANSFYNSQITDTNLENLVSVDGVSALESAFANTKITTLTMNKLESINGTSAFRSLCLNCSLLTSASFNKLSTISTNITASGGPTFAGCVKMEHLYLGGLKSTTFSSSTTQIQNLFNSSTSSQASNGCTVHFPSNFDPSDPDHTFDISTLGGYPTFGGDANYIHVAFDLPATE